MTWNTLTNLAHEQLVVETHMDQIRENIEHVGAMGLAGSAFSTLATGTYGARIAVGSYSGNSTDNRNITGVGFTPKFVLIQRNTTSEAVFYISSMTADQSWNFVATAIATANYIQAVNSDGFQVGNDAKVNASGSTYYYMCLG